VATIFGTPLAGAALLAINYRRLGVPGGLVSILLGVVGMAAMFVCGFALYEHGTAFWVATLFAVVVWLGAGLAQGEVYHQNLASGGEKASWVSTLGIAFACNMTLIGLIVLAFLLADKFF
jgi:hypothetical protein